MADSLYIGLMSGTSMDAIDAALVRLDDAGRATLQHTRSHPLPDALRQALQALTRPGDNALERLMACDQKLGDVLADATRALLDAAGESADAITALGCHGQTVRHYPPEDGRPGATLQLGDLNRLAYRSGITTVGDFRRKDMAAGGHGAPLAPAFHRAAFASPDDDRVIVNLGGIANITWLPRDGAITGFDTGPANGLMDAWVQARRDEPFDTDGAWAAGGTAIDSLLQQWRAEPWFAEPPPKSTGRDRFHLDWLRQRSPNLDAHDPRDVQATLAELTVTTLADAIRDTAPAGTGVYVAGGGAHNAYLMKRLGAALDGYPLATTEALGLAPDWVEAAAFAWLAHRRLHDEPGNLPTVTGAEKAVVLGAVYRPD